jgi:ABC-2 type transport system ATP-binding protein
MTNAVELKSVTKAFGSTVAVDDLDLSVPEGSIHGFIGPNGSGKTTTLRLMLRIFQPDTGCVTVLGTNEGTMADDRVGYLPEERGLYKRMKVIDVIEYFARLKGFFACRQAANDWLERLDATSWANKRVDALSKGMAQKVQFIAAVIARPKLVILDEPFAGLDPVNLEILKDATLSLRREGATVIFSTHDMNTAEQICDTIFMIYKGRKVLDGPLQDIQNRYPVGNMKVRLAGGADLPPDLPGIANVSRSLGYFVLGLANGCQPQIVLQQLATRAQVEHFEVVRPSLHDIFVDIARPKERQQEAVDA